MSKIKVIVADDHPAFREGLCRIFKDVPDFEVIAMLENGLEAVESAKKLQPDVAVIDVSMPGLDGIKAAEQIREACPEMAILMVSADSQSSYVLAALRSGASGYISKNAPVEEIIGAVRFARSGGGVFEMKTIGEILRRRASEKFDNRQDSCALHPREVQVLSLAAKGIGNKTIASQLCISERTVQTHLANIFKKLKVSSRTEAILHALKQGWITLDVSSDETEQRSK